MAVTQHGLKCSSESARKLLSAIGVPISVDTLIRELRTYKLVDQYLFHTEKALTALHFVESRKIEL